MRSVFILISAFIACTSAFAQDVPNSSYPVPVDSSRIQAKATSSVNDHLPVVNHSHVESLTGTNIVMMLPAKWARKPVKVEIFNEKGKLVRSITEKKASPFIIVSLDGIPLGAYELRTSCGKESNSQVTIVAGQS